MKRVKVIINNHVFLISFIFLLVLWQISCMLFDINSYILPSPLEIVLVFINNFKLLLMNTLLTLSEALIGLFLSVIISIAVAILFNEVRIINKILYPYLVIFQTFPLIAIAPLLTIWLGMGISSKIVLIVLICSFPLITNLTQKFNNIDKDKLNYFKSMNASKFKTYRYLYLNESIDTFFPSLKISITYCITGAILAEYIGAKHGLGIILNNAFNSYKIDLAFAIIIIISILTLILIKLNDIVYMKLK